MSQSQQSHVQLPKDHSWPEKAAWGGEYRRACRADQPASRRAEY